ncbi:MAG: lasso RiPP family leader peptide-containing protein [Elusimicrobia bacterium]|nr:lasso RiPP family leader peptide-containing protein [Elusimicrobiota bacterium]
MDKAKRKSRKRRYAAPRLVEYGSLRALTRGASGTRKETGALKTNMNTPT